MLVYIFLAFVLAGTSYAAYCDWKTTEVSDAVSLLIGGGSVLYYLSQSLSVFSGAAVTMVDMYLVLGTLLFAGGVGTYLKLYRPVFDTLQEQEDGTGTDIVNIVRRVTAHDLPGPVEWSDITGTAFLLFAGLVYYQSVVLGGIHPVVLSVVSGTALFALGWSMYVMGMWGGADAFVLGAVGYAFPVIPGGVTPLYQVVLPAPVSLLILVFTVGAVYSTIYAVYVAVQDGAALVQFRDRVWQYRRRLALVTGGAAFGIGSVGYLLHVTQGVSLSLVLQNLVVFTGGLIGILLLYHFLKVVEDHVMRQTVPADELVPGDVLAEDLDDVRLDADRIVGLTDDQISRVQEQYDAVEIRTGVRFIVAFPFAILLLILVGDPLYLLAAMIQGA